MSILSTTAPQVPSDADVPAPGRSPRELHVVHDEQCVFRLVPIHIDEPTGANILTAAGRPVDPDQVILQVLRAGGMADIRLDEQVNLALGHKFILGQGDRLFRFTINAKQYEWPYRLISGAMVLELAGVDHEHSVKLTREGVETFVDPSESVDLSQSGVEQFVTVKLTWTLIVGGVSLQYHTPLVEVAAAMTRAGFDVTKAWHIYLIVRGQEKKELQLNSIVDLRMPGIEKIRLIPCGVDNGDSQPQTPLRREFKLLPLDTQYLDNQGMHWETICDAERRWLLIYNYPLPAGYSPSTSLLALDIPKDYPASQIDMFYFAPFVALLSAREIPSTQVRATINGITFQGWSRHRNASCLWDPNSDSIRTHMALVESCLVKELGQ